MAGVSVASKAAALLAAALIMTPAASQVPPADDADELIVTYPEQADVYLVLTYRNAAEQTSRGGEHVVETRHGPVTVHVELTGGPETLTVTDWPAGMWPSPPEVTVDDGDEAAVEFIAPMM